MEEQTRVCKRCGRTLPLSMFKNTRWGSQVHVCNDCALEKRRSNKNSKKEEIVERARNMRLKDFTPRELMAELKRRGYTFTMRYVEEHIINSNSIEI